MKTITITMMMYKQNNCTSICLSIIQSIDQQVEHSASKQPVYLAFMHKKGRGHRKEILKTEKMLNKENWDWPNQCTSNEAMACATCLARTSSTTNKSQSHSALKRSHCQHVWKNWIFTLYHKILLPYLPKKKNTIPYLKECAEIQW